MSFCNLGLFIVNGVNGSIGVLLSVCNLGLLGVNGSIGVYLSYCNLGLFGVNGIGGLRGDGEVRGGFNVGSLTFFTGSGYSWSLSPKA